MAKLIPLFSGSKGNSYYIGSGAGGVLIDAGRSCKQLVSALEENNININKISAVLITHEHIDHCSALRVFAKKTGVRVYATEGTMNRLIADNRIAPGTKTEVINSPVAIGNMLAEPYMTSHDTPQPCCYRIRTADGRCAMVATDLGTVTPEIRSAFRGVDALVLESNHDVYMLKHGIYPPYLKNRILSNLGHLSNEACSAELPAIIQNGTMRIILGHLSEQNNTPAVALKESVDKLTQLGFRRDYDYTIDTAPVVTDGRVVLF